MLLELLDPGLLPLSLTGTAFVLLAFWIAVLGIDEAANRTFAGVLLFLGLGTLLGALVLTGPPPHVGRYLITLQPYVLIPTAFLLVHFLSLFPRRRGLLGRSPVARWTFAGLAALLCLWYLLDHTAYATVAPADGQPASAGRGFRFTDYGPLAVFLGIRRPLLALAAVVLARDYARNPAGSGGYSTFLLFAGFAINAVFDGVTFTTGLAQDIADRGSDVWQPGAWMQLALPALTLPIAACALAYMGLAIRHERHDATLQEARRFLQYALPAVALSGFAISFAPWAQALGDTATFFLLGVWRLVVPLLLAYALLRYNLVRLDIQMKAGVRRGILVGVFVGVFFLVSEAAEALVSEDRAPLFGVASAGLLAVVGKPLQVAGERAANGVMPDTQPVHRMGSQARFRMYRDQFGLVQQDGQVTDKERRMLERLAGILGIAPDEVRTIEAGGTPPRDDPPPPRTRRPASVVAMTVAAVAGTGLAFGAASAVLESWAGASSFATGLATAAFVAVLLGPIESVAERLTLRRAIDPAKAKAMRTALEQAWEDGELSPRDRAFLDALQARLGLSRGQRRRIEGEVRAGFSGAGAEGRRRPAPRPPS